jgi:hypothetical protein
MSSFSEQQLDQLVENLGNYVEKNYTELVNPKHSTLRSTLSVLFYAAANGSSTLHKAANAYGIKVTSWHDTLDKIVEATEARGSTAAQKIKDTVVKTKKLDQVFKASNANNPWAKVKLAKKMQG